MYIVVEGIDGSGSSYTFDLIQNKLNLKGISRQDVKNRADDFNLIPKWWNEGEGYILDRFKHYIDINRSLNRAALNNTKDVVQLKGYLTTFMTHSWFLKSRTKEMMDITMNRIVKTPDITLLAFADSSVREKRFEERKLNNTLTEFDLLTLNPEFERHCLKMFNLFKESNLLGEMYILDSTDKEKYKQDFKMIF